MRVPQLRRPLVAAASGLSQTSTTTTTVGTTVWQLQEALAALRIAAGGPACKNAVVEGRRYASVKSQGAYKIRDSSTIPKKLGAKKSGDSYVIPGNIIYKQRGTVWHAGENCGLGRDHTIYALETGYVKYYRDPARHPKRQYIGVVFNKSDKLPYPPHAVRKRRLGMVAAPIVPPAPEPELSPSGIPTQIVRRGFEFSRRPHPRETRILKLDPDSYSYSEESWRLGTLVRTEKRKMGSRRVAMRHRRRRAKAISKEMRAEREDKIARRREALDAQRAARGRKLRAARSRRRAERLEEERAARRQAKARLEGGETIHAQASSPKGAEMTPPTPPGPKAES